MSWLLPHFAGPVMSSPFLEGWVAVMSGILRVACDVGDIAGAVMSCFFWKTNAFKSQHRLRSDNRSLIFGYPVNECPVD